MEGSLRRLAPLLLACAFTLAAQEKALDLDPARTKIDFSVDTTLHRVHGSFRLKRGSIRFDPESGKASGEIVVDVASADTGSGARDRRMHKAVLESDRYPDAVFTPDSISGVLKPEGESEVDVHGMLQIDGGSHEITLHVMASMKAGEITATTRTTIPYQRWGMKNPSTLLLRVAGHVEVEIHLTGRLDVQGASR